MDTKYGENNFGSGNDSELGDRNKSDSEINMKKTLVSILSLMKGDVKTLARYKKRIGDEEVLDSIDTIRENIYKLHKKFLKDIRERG